MNNKFENLYNYLIKDLVVEKKIHNINSNILSKIIKKVSKKINLFSGNCGIFAIALSKFLKNIGKYNMQYMLYVNPEKNSIQDYFDSSNIDIYHIILSVEGNGIDDFFDGHGACTDRDIISILQEYGKTFKTTNVIKIPTNNKKVETFIRNNTNCDLDIINEYNILKELHLAATDYENLINEKEKNIIYKPLDGIIIAIDFDGTCVSHAYPKVGKSIGAEPVLKKFVEDGAKLILWTVRTNKQLEDAQDWFEDNGIELWAVNKNPTQSGWSASPKAHANIYIDDLALGVPLAKTDDSDKKPHVDWSNIDKMVREKAKLNESTFELIPLSEI